MFHLTENEAENMSNPLEPATPGEQGRTGLNKTITIRGERILHFGLINNYFLS